MKSYTIAKASGAPGWDAIEPLRADCVLWEPDCGVRMEQKLCTTDGRGCRRAAAPRWQR